MNLTQTIKQRNNYMEESKLETLYKWIDSSKKLGIELPDNILQQTAELEEKLIREVSDRLRLNLKIEILS